MQQMLDQLPEHLHRLDDMNVAESGPLEEPPNQRDTGPGAACPQLRVCNPAALLSGRTPGTGRSDGGGTGCRLPEPPHGEASHRGHHGSCHSATCSRNCKTTNTVAAGACWRASRSIEFLM